MKKKNKKYKHCSLIYKSVPTAKQFLMAELLAFEIQLTCYVTKAPCIQKHMFRRHLNGLFSSYQHMAL